MKALDTLVPASVKDRPVLAAIANNLVLPLDFEVMDGVVDVAPLTLAEPQGFAVYRYTLVFMLAKCAAEAYPGTVFRVRHSIGPSLWCTLSGLAEPMEQVAARLQGALEDLVRRDEPIRIVKVAYATAVARFRAEGRADEVNLLMHRNPPAVHLSACGGFWGLNQFPLAPRTGLLKHFRVTAMEGGLVLSVPTPESPDAVVLPTRTEPYFQVFRRHVMHTDVTGIETVGDLNRCISERRFDVLVRTVEALHTRELSDIARTIAARRPAVRLVLIAGPSSSGKTTTAKRLATQLRVSGLKPLALSTDDYFLGADLNPLDENGQPDFETIRAVDTARLREDLSALFSGKAVRLRKYDFIKARGCDAAEETVLPERGVILLEGIHALNPELTLGVDDALKFRVYLNAMTQLVLDSCNRISASDTRLLRRLVRDSRYRNAPALKTFSLWPRVIEGERKWIYPYQHFADAVFNSSLDYECAVLKPYALELLNQVKPWDRAYIEARRLDFLLQNVSLAPADAVPGDSILRETIGGSQLDY